MKTEFNGVYRDLVLDDTDGIKDFQMFEIVNGTEVPYTENPDAQKGDSNVFSLGMDGNTLRIMIYSPSENVQKTFRLKYSILNVAVMHKDTGELYYKYLGDENETSIDYFSAVLTMPQLDRDKVKIFAHGPLNGNINFMDNNIIKLEVENVSPNTFIEARVLYPNEYTPLSNNIGNNNLTNILNEEQSFARELEEKAARREVNKGIFNKLSIAMIAVGAAVSGLFLTLIKRDPEIYQNRSQYPEDISPAELNIFMNQAINSRGLMATIFDLARRGYIAINELEKNEASFSKRDVKKKDFEFTKTNMADGDLLDHERFLLDWLLNEVGNGKSVSTFDIDYFRKKQMMVFNKSQAEWGKLVSQQLKTRDYKDTKSSKIGLIILFVSMPIFIIGIFALVFEAMYGIAALVINGLIFVYGIILMTRKSDKGQIQYNLWKDFKKEFENYGQFDIGIPKDKTLIYAVALGFSMKELNERRISYGNDYYPMYWGIWYFNTSNRKGGSAFEDRFNSSFYGSTGTSTPNSTTFGGGGGFSGGGGGGAGGGGSGGF